MHLENIVLDAADPQRLGRFWAALLGAEPLTDTPELFEARIHLGGTAFLDICLPRVAEPASPSMIAPRLHLDLAGGSQQAAVVARALDLGGQHLDIGQGDVPWVVMADVEANPFCVMESREVYAGRSPIAALPLDCADPERDLPFWQAATGWSPVAAAGTPALAAPSGRGPLLELLPEGAAKAAGTKNRLHLDTRAEPGEDGDDAVARLVALGGREVDHGWGELPWRVLTDPSGNEMCLLRGPA